MEFSAAFIQKPLDEGLSEKEIIMLFKSLSGTHAIPMEIQAENAVAMGFVNLTDAEFMNYDLRKLEEFVKEIISDVEKENYVGWYEFPVEGVGVLNVFIGY